MAKRFAVLVAMLAAMLATAVPSFAQEEAPGAPVVGSEQYAPQASPQEGEEFAGFGVVENLGGGRYGLRLGPLEGLDLKGDFDFATLEGENVYVTGRFTYENRGTVLVVDSIESAAGAEQETAPAEATTPERGALPATGNEASPHTRRRRLSPPRAASSRSRVWPAS